MTRCARCTRRGRLLVTELGVDPGSELVALEQAILRQDPSLVVAAALPEPSAICPYLGLVPYDVDDSDGFFGREREVDACLDRLSTVGVLMVVGPSGSGKSSLVRAGVAAALRRSGRHVVVITPGRDPLDALIGLPATGPPPVLVVDQCEEAVTLCDDPAAQATFFAALAAHAERAPLVVALRADRLGELSAHPDFARLVEPGLHLLSAMSDADLRGRDRGSGPPSRSAAGARPGRSAGARGRGRSRAPCRCCRTRCTRRGSGARAAPSPSRATRTPEGSAARSPSQPRRSTTRYPPPSGRCCATCCCAW